MSSNCVICGNIIEAFNDTVEICNNESCEFMSRSLLLNNNFVTQFIKSNYDESILLLNMAKNAICCDNAKLLYKPIPKINNINIDTLKTIIDMFTINNEIKQINALNTDLEIVDKYGPTIYGFIKFTLKSNLINIKKIDMFKIKKLHTYEVIHDDYNISEFNKLVATNGSRYLFHGSHSNNWYSIMMNGLQIYSNTSRMTNGRAYGDGIYLSDSFQLSQSYSQKYSAGTFIVGVFEIIGDISRFSKANNIYVVNDIKMLRMKYIIQNVSNHLSMIALDQITNKFKVTMVQDKKIKINYFTNMRNKRLMMEIQKAPKDEPDDNGLMYEINEDNMYIWTAYISNIDKETNLYKDMQNLKIDQIKMEIRFDQQYPIKPPFVRIVSPIFQFKTGHITIGGSICMELLTNQGWSPVYTIESLMIQIKATIIEDGRLDYNKKNITYSFEESQTAFKRMVITHGWN